MKLGFPRRPAVSILRYRARIITSTVMKPTRQRGAPPDRRAFAPRRDRPQPSHAAGTDIVFGIEPIRELLAASPGAVRTLYLDRDDQRRFSHEIRIVTENGGRIAMADREALTRMAGSQARHQGLVAEVGEYQYADLDGVLAAWPDPLLLIDGVTDPRNLGAILRSAEGAGLGSVILARDRTAAVTPAAIKASAGAWAHLRIARCGNVVQMLERIKENGWWVAALVPGGETSLYDLDCTRRLAIVVGAEDRGVRQLVKKTVDFRVGIPMRGKVDSLNVAVATAVALYDIARRRRIAPDRKD